MGVGGRDYEEQRKPLGVLDILSLLIVVVPSWICTHTKPYQIVYSKYV